MWIGFSMVASRISVVFGVPSTVSSNGQGARRMTTRHPDTEGRYYTDTDIAHLLGISIGRLRNKLAAGSPLPPRIQPPGCRSRLWPREAVHMWLEQFLVTSRDDSDGRQILGQRDGAPRKEARAPR